MTSLTQRLADFAAGLDVAAIPADVVGKIRLHLLDALGCGLAGARADLTQRALAATRAEHAAGPCPALGARVSLAPAGAAFVNATAMNAFDHDDGFEVDGKGMGHPGATLVDGPLAAVAARVTATVDPDIDRAMSGDERRPAGQVRVLARGRWHEGPRFQHPRGCRERLFPGFGGGVIATA